MLYRKKRGKIPAVPASAGCRKLPGERCGKNMSFGKNLFDFSAIVISLAIGFIGTGRPVGIGIGTVIAMVCTGRVIAVFNHFAKKKIEEITSPE